jgi:hypothetical protein
MGHDPLDWIGSSSQDRWLKDSCPAEDPAGAGDSCALTRPPPSGGGELERQLMVLDLRDHLENSERRHRKHQILFLLVLASLLAGAGLYVFDLSRKHWTEQVHTLRESMDAIEREKSRSDSLFREVIGWKDEVIEDKEMLVREMQSLHRQNVEVLQRILDETTDLRRHYEDLAQAVMAGPAGERDATERENAGGSKPEDAGPEPAASDARGGADLIGPED